MSFESHDRSFHKGHYSHSGPSTASSQWSDRHYQDYQTPHVRPETASSQHYRQEPRWASSGRGNAEEQRRVSADREWRREQERRRARAHPQPHRHSDWTEHPTYSENSEGLAYLRDRTFLPRVARGDDLDADRGYAPAYESHPDPVSRSNGGASRGWQDEHAWSWDVRDGHQGVGDEYNGRGAYRREQQGSSTESSRVHYSSEHRAYGTAEIEHGDSHQPHCEESVYHREPRRHGNESQGLPSEWDEDIQNMLPSQVNLYKGIKLASAVFSVHHTTVLSYS